MKSKYTQIIKGAGLQEITISKRGNLYYINDYISMRMFPIFSEYLLELIKRIEKSETINRFRRDIDDDQKEDYLHLKDAIAEYTEAARKI